MNEVIYELYRIERQNRVSYASLMKLERISRRQNKQIMLLCLASILCSVEFRFMINDIKNLRKRVRELENTASEAEGE